MDSAIFTGRLTKIIALGSARASSGVPASTPLVSLPPQFAATVKPNANEARSPSRARGRGRAGLAPEIVAELPSGKRGTPLSSSLMCLLHDGHGSS